jgi:hypothetical protein
MPQAFIGPPAMHDHEVPAGDGLTSECLPTTTQLCSMLYNLTLQSSPPCLPYIRKNIVQLPFLNVSQDGMFWTLQLFVYFAIYPPPALPPLPSLLTNCHKADTGLPSGWEVRHSNSKNLPYYFNEAQKQSRWEPPSGTDTDKLKVYMAEHHSQLELAPDTSGLNGNATSGKIRASHLLIKHRDSRRPSSWRQVGCTHWGGYDLLTIDVGEYHEIKRGSY